MPIDRRELERRLLELGFTVDERDHERFRLFVNGRPVARTHVSRGSKYRTMDESILADIARELHITRRFLYQLVSGEKTREDYLDELSQQGLL